MNSYNNKYYNLRIKTKLRLFNHLQSYNNKIEGINILEKLMTKYFFMISKSFKDYVNGNISKRRKLIVWILITLNYIVTFRYILSAIINKPWIWALIGDSNYIMGEPRFISLTYPCFSTCIALVATFYAHFESSRKFEVISFLHKIQTNRIQNLENKYYYKFCLKSKIIAKNILEPSIWAAALLLIIAFWASSVFAYYDPNMEYSLIGLIVWNIIMPIWLTYIIANGYLGYILYYISVLYLKYQFRQLNDKIKNCIITRNTSQVLMAIEEHHYYTKLTEKLNTC